MYVSGHKSCSHDAGVDHETKRVECDYPDDNKADFCPQQLPGPAVLSSQGALVLAPHGYG